MNSTVQKLMALADEYADEKRLGFSLEDVQSKRKHLQDELVRLFTPLTDEQIESLVTWEGDKNDPHYNRVRHGRSIEKAHGITGESK